MKKRRFLASLLTTVMLLSALPAGALAAPTDGTGGNPADASGDLFLDKTATLENDGSYTIKMEAYSTGTSTTITETKGVPLDIVLVLDQSGSMAKEKVTVNGHKMTRQELLKQNVTQFINTVVEDGRTHQVTHRVGMVGFASGPLEGSANGTNYNWTSTGIFDANGDFRNMRPQKTKVEYEAYNGSLDPEGEYYVNHGGQYIKLDYDPSGEHYVIVSNPDTASTNFYGQVNGKYYPVKYGHFTEYLEASNPSHTDGKTYYEKNGTKPLVWIEVQQTTYEYTPAQSIEEGKTYYIDYNRKGDANAEWHSISHRKGGTFGITGWWDNTDTLYGVSNGKFKYLNLTYTPYTRTEKVTNEWVLSANGQDPVEPVYEKSEKDGWYCDSTKSFVTDVYEKLADGKWTYTYEKWPGNETVELTTEQVYTQHIVGELTDADYAGALVQVTDGPDGQGEKRQSLDNAVNNIQANGATRPALGMEMANRIFQENPLTEADVAAGRQRIVIVFTDGVPGYYGYDEVEADRAVAESYITKNTYGAKVYTIGLFNKNPEPETANFLSYLSSNYPAANTTYKKVLKPHKDGTYYIAEINGGYALVSYGGNGWEYLKGTKDNGSRVWDEFDATNVEFFEKTTVAPGDRQDPSKDYSAVVTNPDNLTEIFQSIQQDITSSSTTVDLNEQSIIRDIMPQRDFGLALDRELTDTATVAVQIVPGVADDQGKITWKDRVAIPGPTVQHKDDGTGTGGTSESKTVNVNNMDMTIKVSTFTKKDGVPCPHTVDVTGFDYSKQYIAPGHDGAKLVVTIRGLKVLPTAATDEVISTNRPESGLWKQPGADGTYPSKPEATFEQPTTYFPSKTYVLDYAKPLNVPLKDLKLTSVKNLDADGFDPFDKGAATLVIDQKYGKAEVKNSGTELTYTPQTMQWDGGDTFYAFGKTDNQEVTGATANQSGNAWSKVTVIPANNVYYEDTFETSNDTGTVGIIYNGTWDTVTDAESGQNAGSAETGAEGDNHGWIPVLEPETGDSDGTSHHANAGNGNVATASFTFTGTGVDVYSRTNNMTGTIMATLRDANGKPIEAQVVDTLSASGDYYQIPTLSFHNNKDGSPLTYGTYTVEIRVTSFAQGRYEYYLDGIRIYNPAQGNTDVTDQYEPEEQNAAFVEVRDVLLDANSFSGDSTQPNGPVFIDQLNGADGNPDQPGTTDQVLGVGSYQDLGPKNEVYLKPNQSISFKVDNTAGNEFCVGLKSPAGAMVGATGADGGAQLFEVSHTADMFYKIGPAANGIITITNMSKSDELLAITKLKVTNAATAVDVNQLFAPIENEQLLTAVQEFRLALENQTTTPVEPEDTTPDEPTEPEVTVPTEPEVTEPAAPDVDITNPEPVEPSEPTRPSIADLLEKVFGGFRGWF